MSIEAMKQALENELSASDFIDKAPQSWDKTERTEWARLQAMLHNIRVFKKAMRQAIAEAEKQDKFCDDNCVWTDHHKDCVRASVSWKDMAFARLGVVRDKMHPDDVATVQRFLDDDYTRPQPKREWVGLTDEESEDIWNRYCDEMGEASINDAPDIARAIESALRSKNT